MKHSDKRHSSGTGSQPLEFNNLSLSGNNWRLVRLSGSEKRHHFSGWCQYVADFKVLTLLQLIRRDLIKGVKK